MALNFARLTEIRLKRVYDEKSPEDGPWILVERLWPRGVRKEKIDHWARDLAPSNELRVWFSHDPSKWEAFRERYIEELKGKNIESLLSYIDERRTVTFVFAASNREMNSAVVLRNFIMTRLKSK